MEKNDRIRFLDSIKGFATICVVLGHVCDGYLSANTFPENRIEILSIYNFIYSFHMPLFFLISGYVFCTAYISGESSKKKIITQIGNLIWIYLVFSCFFGFTKIIFSTFTNNPLAVSEMFEILWIPISYFWYLYVLIVFYAIIALAFKFVISILDNRQKALIVLLVLLGLNLLSDYIHITVFEIQKVLRHAVYFYTGILLCSEKIRIKSYLCITSSLIFIVSLIVFWDSKNRIQAMPFVNVVTSMSGSIALIGFFQNNSFFENCNLLQFIGKHALEIYLIHCIFTAGFRVFLGKLGLDSAWISMVINLIMSIIIPIFAAEVCKKIGIHKWIYRPITTLRNRNQYE